MLLSAKCGRERMCVNRVRVSDGEVRMVLAKSGLISVGSCSCLHAYESALDVTRAWCVEGCAEHEQRVYANPEFRARKKALNGF